METLKAADIKFRVGSGCPNAGAEHAKASKSQKTHIAFGSRVAMPKQPSKPGNSTNTLERQSSNISAISGSNPNLSSSQIDFGSSVSSIPQVEVQRPVLQPRPPKPSSSNPNRRCNPRIRSADRVAKRAKLRINDDDCDNDDDDNEDEDCSNIRKNRPNDLSTDFCNEGCNRTNSSGISNDIIHAATDDNNNNESSRKSKFTVVKSVSEKFVELKMGSQEDEEEYFRKRNDSESQEDSIRSKEGSFSSTAGSEPFFLYSSKPHSVHNTLKTRKNLENSSKSVLSQSDNSDREKTVEAGAGITIIASFESDFHRESSDSEADDAVSRIRRLNGIRKSTPSPRLAENAKIRSSLLKEVRSFGNGICAFQS